jgi:hypothetical protein
MNKKGYTQSLNLMQDMKVLKEACSTKDKDKFYTWTITNKITFWVQITEYVKQTTI